VHAFGTDRDQKQGMNRWGTPVTRSFGGTLENGKKELADLLVRRTHESGETENQEERVDFVDRLRIGREQTTRGGKKEEKNRDGIPSDDG